MRAISCLIQNQGIGDMYRIYMIAQRDQIDFNLSFIPPSFKVTKERDFEPQFMKALYDTGERMGAEGVEWLKRPPVLVSGVDEESPTSMQ